MIKSLREKIIEILNKIEPTQNLDNLGSATLTYTIWRAEELADQILELFSNEKQKWVKEIDFYKLGKEYQQFKLQQKTEKDIDIANAMGWIWDFILFIRKDAQKQNLKKVGKIDNYPIDTW